MNVTFETKDQQWQDETTIYWFHLAGEDYGTGLVLDDTYGIADCNGNERVLDCDGAPLHDGDHETIAVRRHAIVTDEMRFA